MTSSSGNPIKMGPLGRQARAIAKKRQLFFQLLLILSLTGCAHEPTPDLIEISGVDPPSIEQSAELRIQGTGFAEHRPGTLTLDGTLYSPGRSARVLRWSTAISPETQALTVLRISSLHLAQILGGAQHGTFTGSLKLSFEPIMEGRPVLRGEKEQVTLDFFAPDSADPKGGRQFMEYLGLTLSPTFVVEKVEPKSLAAGAGLARGDQLLVLDGVHLDGHTDFVPTPHATTSVLSYSETKTSRVREVQLRRSDFQLIDAALTEKGLAIALGLALALVISARPPRFLVWILGGKRSSKESGLAWLEGLSKRYQGLAYLSFGLVAVTYYTMVGGGGLTLGHLDFLICLGTGVLGLLVSAFVLGGAAGRGRFSMMGAFGSTTTSLLITAPIIIAALCRSSEIGSLELHEIDRAQSVLPPQIGALQSPWSLLLALGYILALIPLAGRRPPVFGKPGAQHKALLLGRLTEWFGSLTLQALFLSLFLGAQLEPTQGGQVLRALVFCIKLALLSYLIAVLRARVGYIRLSEAWSLWGSANLLQALLCTGLLVLSWTRFLTPITLELKSTFALALGASFLVFVAIAQTRSWIHSGRRSDPWI